MKFIRRHKRLMTALIIAVLVLAMSIASLFASGRISPVSELLGSLLRPFQSLLTGLADGVGGLYGYLYDYENLLAENEVLRLRNAELEEDLRKQEKMVEEVERLRELVGIKETRPDFEFVDADIIALDVSNWTRTLTLDKGSASGLAVGNCVLSAEGYLVGIVSHTAQTWATVVTLTDTDMSAGAIVFRTGQTAVAEGRFDLMQTDRLGLFYLPKNVDLNIGDVVLTSGTGGIYPKDIPIGTVAAVREERDGMSAMAELTPSAQLDRLKVCYVVVGYDVSEAMP